MAGLYSSQITPTERRRRLRAALSGPSIARLPGAFSPLVARAIGEAGFEGVYVSGAVVAADLALPDIGLTTLTEVAARSRQIARATDLPVLVDADTGFGEPMSAARTDAAGVEGIDSAIERAKAYRDAGADLIFTEALHTEDEFARFREAVPDVPLLANMTEFGKTELLPAGRLEELGYDAVIYPVTTLRIAMGQVEKALGEIAESGTQTGWVDRMQHRARLYELLRYAEYNDFDQSVFTYSRENYDPSN